MPMTETGTEALAQQEAQRQQQLDDFRKNAALDALTQAYGPQAGDPDVWLKGVQAKGAADVEPTVGPAAQADLAEKQQALNQKRLLTVGAFLKGQSDPNVLDSPLLQQFGGFSPDDAAKLKPFITGADGKIDPARVDALTSAGLGSVGMLFKGAPVITMGPDGNAQATFYNPRGVTETTALPGQTPGLMNAQTAQGRLDVARQRVAQAAQNNNVALTPQGLELATQQYIKTGQMPAFGIGGARQKTQIINNAAAQGTTGEDIAGNAQAYKSKQTALNDLAHSGPTSAGGLVRSAGAVLQHIDVLDQFIDALGNRDIKAANALSQRFKEETGSAAPTNFNLQKQIVSSELGKFLVGGRATLTDRKELQDAISRANSPAQLRGAIQAVKADLGAQLGSQYQQFESLGAGPQYLKALTPAARFMITGVAEPGNTVPRSTPQHPGGVPRITGDADFAKLPSGAQFIAPDGSVRVKH